MKGIFGFSEEITSRLQDLNRVLDNNDRDVGVAAIQVACMIFSNTERLITGMSKYSDGISIECLIPEVGGIDVAHRAVLRLLADLKCA
jgi:hypothetical protein